MGERRLSRQGAVSAWSEEQGELDAVASTLRRLADLPDLDAGLETQAGATCITIADFVRDGVRNQWTTWLEGADSVVICCWQHRPGSGWTRKASFTVRADAVSGLKRLLRARD